VEACCGWDCGRGDRDMVGCGGKESKGEICWLGNMAIEAGKAKLMIP
jgi:hypothetical protein